MRKICCGLLAAVLTLGLIAAQPVQAKVYKMDPEERAQALKEKKAKRAKAKKSGKAAEGQGQGQGGWVEVKPGEKVAKKSRKNKVDEIAQAAEKKGKPSKKAKKAELEPKADKPAKKSKKLDSAESAKAEKKGKKGKKSASRGDRLVGSSYGGEQKVRGTSNEVRRPDAPQAKGDDLNAYSVSRPGQEKAAPSAAPAVIPEVRQEVQPGPLDTAKPIGTEQKGGEGRF